MADKSSALSTLSSTIKKGVGARLKDLHTSMPGIVESFDPVKQLATVQPAVKRIFVTREEDREILVPENLPILINVPVVFPRGGGFSLTFPVKKGDECLLTFCERSIDNWHEFGTVREPGAKRFHDLSDAVAFVGISSIPNKIPNYDPDNVQLKSDNDSSVITVKADGNVEIKVSTKVTIDSPDTQITGNLEVLGDTVLSETVTSNGKDISDTHTHTGSPTAPLGPVSTTGVPT